MTVYRSKPVAQLRWGLLPLHYDQWLVDTQRCLARATVTQPVSIMPWHPHVVAEGYVSPDDDGLRRALVLRQN